MIDLYCQNSSDLSDYDALITPLTKELRQKTVERHLEILPADIVIEILKDDLLILAQERQFIQKALARFAYDTEFLFSAIQWLEHSAAEALLEENFSLISDGYQLARAIPPECRGEAVRYWVNKGWDKIGSAAELAMIISRFGYPMEAELVDRGWGFIKDHQGLVMVATVCRFPRTVWDRGWDLVTDFDSFQYVLLSLNNLLGDIDYLLDKGAHFIEEDENFIKLIRGSVEASVNYYVHPHIIYLSISRVKHCKNFLGALKSLLVIFEEAELKVAEPPEDTDGSFKGFLETAEICSAIKGALEMIETLSQWRELLRDSPKRYQWWLKEQLQSCFKDICAVVEEEQPPPLRPSSFLYGGRLFNTQASYLLTESDDAEESLDAEEMGAHSQRTQNLRY